MSYSILLVDDSSIVRKAFKKVLAMTSLDVSNIYEAEHGQQALKVLGENWVDLVFLDINMPVMNGIEFLKNLRADTILSSTPVIVISTEGSDDRMQQLQEMQVKDYLRKPVTPEELVAAVTDVLGESAND